MRRSIVRTIILVFALSDAVSPAAPPSGDLSRVRAVASSPTHYRQRKLHDVGNVRVKIGSDGTFGSHNSGGTPDTADSYLLLREGDATFEYPAKSRAKHSFIGGLWVGGIRDWDTLVSAAATGGSNELQDFHSQGPMRTHMDSSTGHQTFRCVYADTMPSTTRSPGERPLGVEVSQVSHAFAGAPYDRFVYVEYRIRNISGGIIHSPYVGFFDDGDVFNELVTGQSEPGAGDDVAGFIRSHALAYIMDNNGDPVNSTWASNSCVSTMAIAPLLTDPPPQDTSFNWWATNWGNIDWGPGRLPMNGSSSGTVLGIPHGPREMYRVMANHEVDYDQLWSAVDMTASGWHPPPNPGYGRALADGMDTRILLSFGFPDLEPGDSIRVVVALVAGDSIHVRPEDFREHFDFNQPDVFYSKLDFSGLIRNVELARYGWSNNFELYGAAPAPVILTPVADDAMRCVWPPAPFHHVAGYRLYLRFAGEPTWHLNSRHAPDEREAILNELRIGADYELTVSTVDLNGVEGVLGRPIRFTAGQPTGIPHLNVRNIAQSIRLTWVAPQLDTGLSSLSALNIYRRAGQNDDFVQYRQVPLLPRLPSQVAWSASQRFRRDPFSMTSGYFDDDSTTPGVAYHYRISISNDLRLEGPLSDPDSALRMPMEHKGLVIFHTFGGKVSIDTMRSFYGAWASTYGFDTCTPTIKFYFGPNHPPHFYPDLPLDSLISHEAVVLVVEDPGGTPQTRDPFYGHMQRYLANGGRIIFVTRNHIAGTSPNGKGTLLPLIEDAVGVHATHVESGTRWIGQPPKFSIYLRSIFQSAIPAVADYPRLDGDSALGWQVLKLPTLPIVDSSLLAGWIFEVGCLDSLDAEATVLYTYHSAYDTSFFHGKPIAVKRITDTSAAILFNFPLSLMKRDQAWRALTQAVVDLGIDTTNYWTPPVTNNRAMIEWLYGKSTTKPNPDWDINRDGVIDIRDVVSGIKR